MTHDYDILSARELACKAYNLVEADNPQTALVYAVLALVKLQERVFRGDGLEYL